MFDSQTITAMVVALLTSMGGLGFWNWVQNRHKPVLDAETSAVSSAKTLTEQALVIATRADERSRQLEDDVARLQQDLLQLYLWASEIHHQWDRLRAQQDPPTLPDMLAWLDPGYQNF